jgi:L-histidine N-alpha-methyltransferase
MLNHDTQPHFSTDTSDQHTALARDVIQGLSAAQKTLSSAWFYDDMGSQLFQQIMDLPEYYLTRAEHDILRNCDKDIAHLIAPAQQAVDLIELGSGDGQKTMSLCRTLCQLHKDFRYFPVDFSQHALSSLQQRFAQELPQVPVHAQCGDYFEHWPTTSLQRRQLVMFLGSNLGNFQHDEALGLLRRIRSHLKPGDGLLLGLDLKKNPHTILAAYNDAQGVTARFNLNLLTRLNRELHMNFVPEQFSHYASYSPLDGIARSFLVSRRQQIVSSKTLAREFVFQAGETIYTEQSQKYDRALIQELASSSGYTVQTSFHDPDACYTLVAWRV